MKTDLISRQDAVDALYKMLHDCFGADDEELDAVITTLNELPSEQRKGKWIYLTGLDAFECSVCGSAMVRNIFDYCPWCGARMVKGKEKNNE